ncbi:MAG: hypothetical protein RLY43_1613 [Bacteroidota bacterium]|jgi:hypothetical protein
MNIPNSFYKLILLMFITTSCSQKSSKQSSDLDSSENDKEVAMETYNYNDCNYEDGVYTATVNYYNPETDYSSTYTLDVEVANCEVIQINFPNDGYLDESSISNTTIDENGNAFIDGEDGKTYEVHLD